MSPSRIRPVTIARSAAGYVMLLSSMLFFLASSLFVEPRRVLSPIKAQLRWMFRAFGLRARVTGLEHLRPGRTYLFMCNHVSHMDHFMLLALIPGYFVGLEAIELAKWPLYGWAGARWGQIRIRRGNREAALEACRAVVDGLAGGLSVVVFPEGQMTRDGQLGPLKKGVFHIAVDAQAEVVPVVLKGLHPLAPRGAMVLGTGDVEIRICPPLAPPPVSEEAHADLAAKVRAVMLDALG
jgi:1-acyl-sn-glycerol-3-phosphate acyltransferase